MGSSSQVDVPWARVAALVAVLIAFAFALTALPSRGQEQLQPLHADWGYAWTSRAAPAPSVYQDIRLPAHPRGDGEVLWLRRALPKEEKPDATLAVSAVLGPFEAYLDGVRIFHFPEQGLDSRGPPGLPWQLIPLQAGHGGKLLELRILADYRPAGVKGVPLYGERGELLAWAVKRDTPRLVVGGAVILLGVFGVFALGRKEDWRLALGYLVYTVALGIYVINYTHLKDLLVDAPRFWFALWVVALPLMPVGGALFVDELFGSGRAGWIRRVFQAYLAYAVLLLAFDFVAWPLMEYGPEGLRLPLVQLFTWGMNLLRVSLIVAPLVLMAVVARRSYAGDPDAKIYLVGAATVFAFGIRDVFAALGAASLSWRSQLHLGVLVQAVALAWILQRRYVAAHQRAAHFASELESRAREKQLMLRDLHDGIGSLTSNVRMLAEMGTRRAERAGLALSTIAELSGTALAELRAFVQTLDDAHATWDELAIELRRYGAQVVEAQEREFSMVAQVDTLASPPGVVSLNVLRIFREAVTNALKQPGGSRVEVSLRVDAEGLELVVGNDGDAAIRGPGVNAERGLKNLTARARELGGELVFEAGEWNRLRLTLPLPQKTPNGEPQLGGADKLRSSV